MARRATRPLGAHHQRKLVAVEGDHPGKRCRAHSARRVLWEHGHPNRRAQFDRAWNSTESWAYRARQGNLEQIASRGGPELGPRSRPRRNEVYAPIQGAVIRNLISLSTAVGRCRR